tara:strand:+ start:155 stop:484 length:330 start_codon:yes stop_codon:yes gene_type:complete
MGCRTNKSLNSTKPNIKFNKLSRSLKGVVGEYQCCVDFTKQGKWVFKAIDPQSPCDLITLDKNGKVELIDVKTNTYRKNVKSYRRKIWRIPTAKQKKLGIKILMVDHGN